jgi:hypothetical protein
LAYVRVWSPDLQLRAEITRLEPRAAHAGAQAVLPGLGIREASDAAAARRHGPKQTERILMLQQLVSDQGELTAMMERAGKAGPISIARRNAFYEWQANDLLLADSLEARQPLLIDAIREMEHVGRTLTIEEGPTLSPEALTAAMAASDDAESALGLALEDCRATVGRTPPLPAPLAAAAPPPASLWGWLWPELRGRRVLSPLFVPGTRDELATPAGSAEVVFYDRRADLLARTGWRPWPAVALLAAAVWTLIPRRRRRRR